MHPVNVSIHSSPARAQAAAYDRRPVGHSLLAAALAALGAPASAQDAGDATSSSSYQAPVQQLARQAVTGLPAGTRVEIDVGNIDARLKLAPCARITPYLPAGARLWGRVQVGLRCDEGARWNVFVPVTVKVFARAWTSAQSLPAGTVVSAAHLQQAEVDLAAESSPVVATPEAAVGRSLARALRPGQAVREADLKARLWFAAGDTVRVISAGSGFAISAEGQALGAGVEGQTIKVRTENGRIVQGRATGARQVEVAL
jgi:flagellar basal body P-ring formation protein FlgA